MLMIHKGPKISPERKNEEQGPLGLGKGVYVYHCSRAVEAQSAHQQGYLQPQTPLDSRPCPGRNASPGGYVGE